MIGTIRKHSTWMWGIIITGVIISFVYWGANPGGGGGGSGGGGDNYGTIYDRTISRKEFVETYREMEMRYFFSSGEWPGSDAARRGFDPNRETYFRILLLRKAAQLDIHASLDATAKAAGEMLRNLNRGNPVPLNEFVRQALAPRGLGAADFERYMRNELIIQQVLGLAGSSGRLVTPQDARALYEREHQEYVAQAVFFHPSNYLSAVTSTPEAVSQFFTNQMARYRIPERIRVSYVKFEATNFFNEAVTEINQITNLTERLEMVYNQRGGTNFYTEKSATEAQAEILKEEQNRVALQKARAKANVFAAVVMEAEPIRIENFVQAAAASNLTVEVSLPFTPNEAPPGLKVGEEFVRSAYGLTDVEPVAGPVMGPEAAYVIALHSRLPSEMPAYETIRERVTSDYTFYESAMAVRVAGSALAASASNALAAGQTFSVACLEAKVQPVLLPPFSLSSTNVSDVERHVDLTQFKQALFMTPVGRSSSFVPNNDGGGFLVFVQQKLPVDEARLAAALPGYLQTVRQARQNDAVNAWVSAEGNRDPGFRGIMTEIAKRNQPAAPGGAAPVN